MSPIKPSPTLGITSKANAMLAQGIDVIRFSAGEPDFNTPEPVQEAAIKAMRDGKTKYCASAGLPELRSAVCEKFARENGLSFTPNQIVVSCGAKHSIFNAMQVLLEPGDEVILIAPYWMTYVDQVLLAGGTPTVVQTTAETGFCPTREQLDAVVSPQTRAIILNSPSNPTGAVFPRETMEMIAEFALRNELWIVADEIYEHLTYGAEHVSVATLSDEVKAQTLTVSGCSKSYAMTGWRVGYTAAPAPVAQAMSDLQDQMTSNATTFCQYGAIAALNLPMETVMEMRDTFQMRRDTMYHGLRAIEGVRVTLPEGAFYLFADVSGVLPGGMNDVAFCDALLEQAHVAVVPGSVFHGDRHIRLSYATNPDLITEGVSRIARAVAEMTV